MRRAAAAAIVVLLLAGCGSVPDRVHDALDSAIAATASASTALTLLDEGRALPAYTDTVIGDALTELDSATTDLTQLGPVGDAAEQRQIALSVIRFATNTVLDAREAVATGDDVDDARDAVDEALDALRYLS